MLLRNSFGSILSSEQESACNMQSSRRKEKKKKTHTHCSRDKRTTVRTLGFIYSMIKVVMFTVFGFNVGSVALNESPLCGPFSVWN